MRTVSAPLNSGYARTCWPAEDGGPTREQAPAGITYLLGSDSDRFKLLAGRAAPGAHMAVIGPDGAMFLLRSLFGHRILKDPAQAVVERIDPLTLETTLSSPVLPAGPWWAGGLAVLASGDIVAVSGRWIHRLDPQTLEVIAARELPTGRPHNSFVVLDDGTIVLKDIDRSLALPAVLHAIDPQSLEDRCEPLDLGETVIARLSADGNTIYAVGVDHAMRIHWDGSTLSPDSEWRHKYRTHPNQGYGWDPVVSAGRLWFLDQGRHRFRISMRGSGLDSGPVRLHAVPLENAAAATEVVICGAPHGGITNPPLIDPDRMIAVGYDTANGWITAFDIPLDPASTPTERWRKRLHTGPHLMRYSGSGELIACDHNAPWPLGTRLGSWLLEKGLSDAMRRSGEDRPGLEPKLAKLIAGEDVVVLDIETGLERARASMPVVAQSVMFPTAGENRDVVMATVTGIFRVGIDPTPGR
ncbi:unannotated protein [freshwater metagenome]|uniref:Unannotated protein n=1 Tax=freshwater metagenome TaxID=449393 RepID=A0A6J7E8I4_9ZZZZ